MKELLIIIWFFALMLFVFVLLASIWADVLEKLSRTKPQYHVYIKKEIHETPINKLPYSPREGYLLTESPEKDIEIISEEEELEPHWVKHLPF